MMRLLLIQVWVVVLPRFVHCECRASPDDAERSCLPPLLMEVQSRGQFSDPRRRVPRSSSRCSGMLPWWKFSSAPVDLWPRLSWA
ncbi:hypothetical protein QBC39DRAFT_183508 [Podospora conica]|nr:hypothetical protein QBC39DRAFT_183508 [Schizothecium conicum]